VGIEVEAVLVRLESLKGGGAAGLAVAELSGALVEDAIAVE
jgi:hypothetical protein